MIYSLAPWDDLMDAKYVEPQYCVRSGSQRARVKGKQRAKIKMRNIFPVSKFVFPSLPPDSWLKSKACELG